MTEILNTAQTPSLKKIALTSSSMYVTADLLVKYNRAHPPPLPHTNTPQGSINILISEAFAQVGNLQNLRRRSSVLPEASKGPSFSYFVLDPRIPASFAAMYLPGARFSKLPVLIIGPVSQFCFSF